MERLGGYSLTVTAETETAGLGASAAACACVHFWAGALHIRPVYMEVRCVLNKTQPKTWSRGEATDDR